MLTHLAFLVSIIMYVVIAHVVHVPANAEVLKGMPFLPMALEAVYVVSIPLIAFASRALPEARSRVILALASYEAGAIYGLILTFIGFSPQHQLFLSAASFLLIALSLLRHSAAVP